MICLLDAIGMGPLLLFGGTIIILFAAIALLCISTIALMVVRWLQHRKEKAQAEQKKTDENGKEE